MVIQCSKWQYIGSHFVFAFQVVDLLNQAALISTDEKLTVLKQVCSHFKNCVLDVIQLTFKSQIGPQLLIILVIEQSIDYSDDYLSNWIKNWDILQFFKLN